MFCNELSGLQLASVLTVLPSILTGRIIDEGFIAGDFNLLLGLVLAAVAVMLASSLLGLVENYLNNWVSENIGMDMKNKMYAHLLRFSQSFYTTNKQGDIITRMTGDIAGVQRVVTGTLTGTVANVAVLLSSVVAMVQKNWLLALVGLAILPLFILPTKFVGKKRWQITLAAQEKNDEANQILNETLSVSGQQLVKIFTNEEKEYQNFAATNEEIRKLNLKESMAGRWFRMAISTFTNIGPMLIYLIGGVLILKPLLQDVSFTVPPQNMTAIVGASGAGKSTITNLLMRLYDIDGGSISIDGRDIRDLDLNFLRSNIGMVTQEAYLFNGSIRENLLYARADATEEELIAACKEANIFDLIETLPQGLDTVVGNRGIKLSGGEKQRLSIARVILKDPAIIIFDEATSALDSISEGLIQEAIEPLLKGRSSLVIAHRLSTILAADQILVMAEGRIVEQGTHADLIEENGEYRSLYEAQFKKLLAERDRLRLRAAGA